MKQQNFLKTAKILASLNHPNIPNLKNSYYQPLASMFECVLFSFSSFGIVCEIKWTGWVSKASELFFG